MAKKNATKQKYEGQYRRTKERKVIRRDVGPQGQPITVIREVITDKAVKKGKRTA